MKKFAMISEFEDYGQVLSKMDSCDETGRPQIEVYVMPSDELGVCHLALKYEDSDEGWNKCEKAWSEWSDEKAKKVAKGIFKEVGELGL